MIEFNRKFDPGPIKLLIFDLDGTLIDSRLDLIHSVNAMLQHIGRPTLPGDVVASYVGDGAPMLVRRALGDPADEALFKRGLEYFLDYYRQHKLDYTKVYTGVKEALVRIQGTNELVRQMAVLSNKPVRPAKEIVEALGLGGFFLKVYGGNSFSTKKPDPAGVNTLLEEIGVNRTETILIGDSSIDIVTARNAGIWSCGVTYGFAPESLSIAPPDVSIDRPEELGELFATAGH